MATLHDDIYQLVREPIDVAALVRHVRAPEDGAIVTFDGFVRNQSHDRPTLYLDYEAYESMALAKMREIGAQLHDKYRIHRVAMVHRLGRLEIGETSVFIAVRLGRRRITARTCGDSSRETCILTRNVDDTPSLQIPIASCRLGSLRRRDGPRPRPVRSSSLGAEAEVHGCCRLNFQTEYDFRLHGGSHFVSKC